MAQSGQLATYIGSGARTISTARLPGLPPSDIPTRLSPPPREVSIEQECFTSPSTSPTRVSPTRVAHTNESLQRTATLFASSDLRASNGLSGSASLPTRGHQAGGQTRRVRSHYHRPAGELSLTAGDLVTWEEYAGPGWCKVRDGSGATGYVPTSVLWSEEQHLEVARAEEATAKESVRLGGANPLMRMATIAKMMGASIEEEGGGEAAEEQKQRYRVPVWDGGAVPLFQDLHARHSHGRLAALQSRRGAAAKQAPSGRTAAQMLTRYTQGGRVWVDEEAASREEAMKDFIARWMEKRGMESKHGSPRNAQKVTGAGKGWGAVMTTTKK